jgi:hypothetical protein
MQNTFDIIGQPNYGYPQPPQQQQYYNYQPQPQKPVEPEIKVDIGSGLNFTTVKDTETSNKMVVHSDLPIDTTPAKRSKKKSSNENKVTDIVKAPEDTAIVEDTPTINTYLETASMIKQSMDQIDTVMVDLKREFDEVRNSRTMKNKYNTIVGLAGNMADLAEARISAIKELNNCISKSNDMDYKRLKDRRDAMAGAGTGDEKAVMDFYRAIVADPNLVLGQPGQRVPDNLVQQIQSQMAPQGNMTSGIIRAPEDNAVQSQMAGLAQDSGYVNYMANMPASMGNILMEQNPDIQECVVFDASTGGKWFQVMNVKTGQPIPNMQITDQMFMEDTVLNPKTKTAQNINLGKTYPLVIINDNVTSNY